MGIAAWPGTFLAFAAMALFVFVTVSSPVWDSVYFLNVKDVSGSQDVHYGFLGWCRGGGDGTCSSTDFGYDISSALGENVGRSDVTNDALNNLTYVLIFNPIAGFFALLSFLAGLAAISGGRLSSLLLTLLQAWAAIFAAATFVIDIAMWAIVRNLVNNNTALNAELGNANWLALAAAASLIIGTLLSTFGICCGGGRRKDVSYV